MGDKCVYSLSHHSVNEVALTASLALEIGKPSQNWQID